MHDITIFRGGEKEVEKSNRDRKAVYFKLKDGERMIGDSGYNGEPNKFPFFSSSLDGNLFVLDEDGGSG